MNVAAGEITDVLFVNGTAGNGSRVVSVAVGQPIEVRFGPAPMGPDPANYAFWMWRGLPSNPSPLDVGGIVLGCTANPTPLNGAATPQPFRCRIGGLGPEFSSGIGHVFQTPSRAPWTLARRQGFDHPIDLTLQGVLDDNQTTSLIRLSVTNAVILRVR